MKQLREFFLGMIYSTIIILIYITMIDKNLLKNNIKYISKHIISIPIKYGMIIVITNLMCNLLSIEAIFHMHIYLIKGLIICALTFISDAKILKIISESNKMQILPYMYALHLCSYIFVFCQIESQMCIL
jgi:hypothetical protein